MTATLSAIRKLLTDEKGAQQWNVESEIRFPSFQGEVTESMISNGHGIYTTDEIFKADYQLLGWIEAGYKITTYWVEYEGTIIVALTQGPIKVTLTYTLES